MQANVRERVAETRDALVGDGRGRVLAAVAAGWFLSLGTRLAVPAILPFVRAEFAIDNTTAGAVITALWVAYALTQFPSGLLTDVLGERRVLVAATALGGASVFLIGMTPGLPGFVAGTILFGLGTGLYATPRVTLVSRIYPERNTTALGVVFASGNVGSVVLPVAAGTLAAAVGWRAGFTGLAPAFGLATASLWWVLGGAHGGPPTDREGADEPDVDLGERLRRLTGVVRKPVLLATATLMLFALAYQGFIGFLAVYLVDVKGLPAQQASLLYGGFFVVGLLAQLVGSDVADEYGRRPTLVVTLLVTVVGLVALPFATNRLVIAAIVGLLGVKLAFWPVTNSYVYDALPVEIEGGGYGLVRTVYLCVGASGPIVVGHLFDSGVHDGAFWLLGGVVVVVLGLCAAYPDVE